MVQAIGIVVFAFTAQTCIFKARAELRNPTDKRMRKVFFFSYGLSITLSLIGSIFGYLSFV